MTYGHMYGYVKGNMRATGKIEIKKDGSVRGSLTTAITGSSCNELD
jgi:cytoskeletal protein CcmA (bactofilin family)